MKITPKITGGLPIGARIDLYIEDVPTLGDLLAFAHQGILNLRRGGGAPGPAPASERSSLVAWPRAGRPSSRPGGGS